MTSKPLQYPSLKIVLEHMEANLRLQLSKRISSIRNVEKIIPMKIDKLSFGDSRVVINDTVYQLGIYLEFPPDVIPERSIYADVTGELKPLFSPYCHVNTCLLPETDTWIQFVTQSERSATVNWIKDNKRLFEKERYLPTFLFGNRSILVKVNMLELCAENELLRLPVGLKFRVKDLKILSKPPLSIDRFVSTIDESSLPIREFTISTLAGDIDFPIMKTANQLVVECDSQSDFPQGLQTISNLPNKHVMFKNFRLPTDAYRELVRNWLDTGREMGTTYVFAGKTFRVTESLMRAIGEGFNEAVIGERQVSIPMKNDLHLKITFVPEKPLRLANNPWPYPLLKFEVL